MKTINFKKLVKGVLISAALVASVVACGNKNKDNPNSNLYQMSCANCGNITGTPFFTVQTTVQAPYSYYSYGSTQNPMRIQWSFSGQNIQPQQQQQQQQGQYGQYSYGPPSMIYSGQVSAIGTASVSSLMNPGICPQIPPGTYNIATRSVGTWNGNGYQAQISSLQIEMSANGYSVIALLSNVHAIDLGYGVNSTRMSGNLQIQSVNGQGCVSNQYYMN